MEIIEKNILECKEDIIVHQVNCKGVMGSGIAKQIKTVYPEVYKGYRYYCKTNLLSDIFGSALICEANNGKYIANVFGQVNYGRGEKHTDYDALRHGLEEVRDFAKENKLTIAIPYKIGCGLGGGDWNTVFDMINEIFAEVDCNIYKLERKTVKC